MTHKVVSEDLHEENELRLGRCDLIRKEREDFLEEVTLKISNIKAK